MATTKWIVGLVKHPNPMPEVCVIKAAESGEPIVTSRHLYSGKFHEGKPILKPAKDTVEFSSPHTIGGSFRYATPGNVEILDNTPRSFEAAMKLAARVPRTPQIPPRDQPILTAEIAKAYMR